MKRLLTITATIEAATAVGLLASPSLVVALLLGASLDTPMALTIARVAGAAILALGVACWLGRSDEQSRAAKGLVGAMMLYNVAVATILIYASIVLGFWGIGLWPAVVLHVGMTGWCFKSLVS